MRSDLTRPAQAQRTGCGPCVPAPPALRCAAASGAARAAAGMPGGPQPRRAARLPPPLTQPPLPRFEQAVWDPYLAGETATAFEARWDAAVAMLDARAAREFDAISMSEEAPIDGNSTSEEAPIVSDSDDTPCSNLAGPTVGDCANTTALPHRTVGEGALRTVGEGALRTVGEGALRSGHGEKRGAPGWAPAPAAPRRRARLDPGGAR